MQFDFTHYRELCLQRNLQPAPLSFLQWFLGFAEGDGSLVCVTRKREVHFVCSQSREDVQILQHIHQQLQIGTLCTQGKRVDRFIVQDKGGIALLTALFGGNLVLPRRQKQFALWCHHWGAPTPAPRKCIPSLQDGWISGFTDAEGCFTASFLSNSNAFRLRYIVTQKGKENLPVLSHLICLFGGGALEAHSSPDTYSYILSGKRDCYRVYRYFADFPLLTKKGHSFSLWQSLHLEICKKRHLDPNKRAMMVEKARKINSIRRKSG